MDSPAPALGGMGNTGKVSFEIDEHLLFDGCYNILSSRRYIMNVTLEKTFSSKRHTRASSFLSKPVYEICSESLLHSTRANF